MDFAKIPHTDSHCRRLYLALHAAQVCVFEVDIANQRYTFFENAEAIYQKSGEQILKEVAAFSSLPPEEYRARYLIIFPIPMIMTPSPKPSIIFITASPPPIPPACVQEIQTLSGAR